MQDRKTKIKKAMENNNAKQEDFNIIMNDCGKAMREYYDGIAKHNEPILKAIKDEKGNDWYKELESLMEDSEVGGAFKIVEEPSGELQESSELIINEWVDQYSVGDSGDCWEGTITVKIGDKKYLEMPFSM